MSFFERPAESILHPIDFSRTSQSAFAHALAIAIKNQADLTLLHVVSDANQDVAWHDYPVVRETLENWGYLKPGSARHDVADKLGINIKNAVSVVENVATTIVRMAETDDFDLIVMATNGNRENPFHTPADVALPISKKTQLPILFVPQDARGFVQLDDGSTRLNQVLVPVTVSPDCQPIIDRVGHAFGNLGENDLHVTLLHVGDEDDFPAVVTPRIEGINWTLVSRYGNIAGGIIDTAEELNADVIAMVTEGRKGFWDVVRGSTVQQVLRRAPCPLFIIPANDWH